MMFHKMVRPTLAAAAALAVSLGFTACSRDYVAAYVYAPSNTSGAISAYGVDYQSGDLIQINGSPFPSQLTNPVTLVTHPNNKFLYLVGGTQNAEVEEYAVGTDGKLYGENTYNITGTYPTAASIDTTGKFLYVTYQYQKAYTPVSTGPGGLTIFPINADGSLGTAFNMNLGMDPAAVAVSPITCAPTAALGTTNPACTGTYGSGNQNVFAAGAAATPSTCTGFKAGVTPSAIAVDPTARFVYVTDKTSNEVIGYTSALTSNGALQPMTSSPYTTGSYPVGLTIDPRGDYLYTANYNGNSVTGFSINSTNGSLGTIASTSGFTTKTGPTCVTIEPALGIYLYTSNYLDGSISGGQLSPNTGQLTGVDASTPFPTSTQPVCIASVANGSHASSLVNP
jgi:6-phosphogluconolactonase